MVVRIRLTPQQLDGILATGSAACARSVTVDAPEAEAAARVERPLAAAAMGERVDRTADGNLLVDASGPFVIEEWVAHLTSFGPKTTVSLRAARAIRTWVVLAAWLLLSPAIGAALAASLFLVMDRVPGFAPGLVFVVGLSIGVYGLRAIANGAATRWTRGAARRLEEIDRALAGG